MQTKKLRDFYKFRSHIKMGNLHAAKIHNSVFFSRLAANTKVRLFQIRGSEQDEKIGLATDPLKPGVGPRGDGTELGLD